MVGEMNLGQWKANMKIIVYLWNYNNYTSNLL
jgi:hypothetical protein